MAMVLKRVLRDPQMVHISNLQMLQVGLKQKYRLSLKSSLRTTVLWQRTTFLHLYFVCCLKDLMDLN